MSSAAPNSLKAIESRAKRGLIPISAPVVLLGLRTLLAFGVALAVSGVALMMGSPDPMRTAAEWWIVTATAIDVGCLAAIVIAVRREGIGVRDLLGYRGPHDFGWVPVALIILAPGLALSSFLTSLSYPPAAPPEIVVVNVTPLAAIYAVVVWPVIWTVTEELIYLGYVLPRLEVLSGRPVAVVLVLTFWSIQHLALPLIPDATYILHRAVTALPVVAVVTLGYFVVGRRLAPLIVVHWLGDLFTAVVAVSSPG